MALLPWVFPGAPFRWPWNQVTEASLGKAPPPTRVGVVQREARVRRTGGFAAAQGRKEQEFIEPDGLEVGTGSHSKS